MGKHLRPGIPEILRRNAATMKFENFLEYKWPLPALEPKSQLDSSTHAHTTHAYTTSAHHKHWILPRPMTAQI